MDIEKSIKDAEKNLAPLFEKIDETVLFNQEKVLAAFQKNRIAPRHFAGTTGYGYDDEGRVALSAVFRDAFRAEAAIASPYIASGTHALYLALSGVLRPGDRFLSLTGKPYDTLDGVVNGAGIGSLRDFGISFEQIDLQKNADSGGIDLEAVEKALKNKKYKLAYIQRSRGYGQRRALAVNEIEEAVRLARSVSSDTAVMVDNCYGEFTETREPTDAGADLIAGSLIKNPGGGLAPSGGYIAGRADLVRLSEYRLTAPGLGCEIGSLSGGYKSYFQGLFLSPHTVGQALKGSLLVGAVMKAAGFKTEPDAGRVPPDLIRSVGFDTAEQLIGFCRQIQYASPVDSYVTCEPWDMPGYADQIIMAAGTFNQGASLELSCDAPILPPYTAYLQGGLTYEHVKIALKRCLERL
ncbi:MAG: methionine gamma-lyase family protein [Clostridiales bacterium]|nr:methionine gamma-lyase family protein [Clostridiales bacterium]